VETDTGPQAVLAPTLLSGREWVIKKLSALLPPLPGLLGATILGDGGIAAVLDLPEIIRGASHGYATQRQMGSVAATPMPAVRALRALVVDDSLSARRALMQTLQDAGFSVEGARDGMEATQMLAKQRPDILLVDLEMPRMNGLELTHHVRHNPELQTLPIIMVTSRSTQKHRDEAASAGVNSYFTKPFQDRELLAQVQALLAQTQAVAG
jgi:chemosensory pili system protein ChpA (sensor histidine kinase/response regulator)